MTEGYAAYDKANISYQVILDHVAAAFRRLGFEDIEHQRLSLLSSVKKSQTYQGLTKAKLGETINYDDLKEILDYQKQHIKQVILKWELQRYDIAVKSQSLNPTTSFSNISLSTLSDIDKEIFVLESIHNKPANLTDNLDNLNLNTNININHSPVVPFIACFPQIKIVIKNHIWQLRSFVMPFYKLGSCRDYLKSHSLDIEQKLQLILKIAITLQKFHESGWVHGDIKPSNFLLSYTSRNDKNGLATTLCDFVNARMIVPTKDQQQLSIKQSQVSIKQPQVSIKQPQAIIDPQGTPAYLAPECWQGRGISVQTDIYAFGVSAYEILLGEKPIKVKSVLNKDDLNKKDRYPDRDIATAHAWAKVHCQSPIPTLPEDLLACQTIIHKLLAKRVETRFQDMQTVVADLIRINKRYC